MKIKLCKDYRYRAYVVDFTKIPLSELLRRNAERGYKKIPEDKVTKMWERSQIIEVPDFFEVISPEEFGQALENEIVDLSSFKKINHFGDIHGCYTVLRQAITEIKADEFYIFTGDYLDRGIENAEVLSFLLSIKDKRNVVLLKGNHEIHLENYAYDLPNTGKKTADTIKELEAEGIQKKAIRVFCRKLRTVFYYEYKGKKVLCTHGGVPEIPQQLARIKDIQFVKGVGGYEFNIDKAFEENHLLEDVYQVHGHRNTRGLPVEASKNSFNLEGGVEHGGHFRQLTLSDSGFESICFKNTVFELSDDVVMLQSVQKMVEVLRKDDGIKERRYGNIASFNFNEDVFYKQAWTLRNVKARGLFINTAINKIVCRGYEKFFNTGELLETTPDSIKKLKYPLTGYLKENGFFGMLGYDEESNLLTYASKSTVDGVYAIWFKNIFMKTINEDSQLLLRQYLKITNACLTFEVIDPEHSPHLIEYPKAKIVLLDVIYRTPVFQKLPYDELIAFSNKFGFEVKQKAFTFKDYESFEGWSNSSSLYGYKYKGSFIEGVVFEDASGYMFKSKLGFYKFWKQMRSIKDNLLKISLDNETGTILKNGIIHPSQVFKKEETSELAKRFILWMFTLDGNDIKSSDIITLRKRFYEDLELKELSA